MRFIVEIAPSIILFVVVVVSSVPAIAQAQMLFLGASAFYTVGVFSSVYLAGDQSPAIASLLFGGLAGALAGGMLGVICSRLRGDYFALATLCFAEFLRLVLLITPGPQGIPDIQRGSLLGFSIESAPAMCMAALLLLVLAGVATTLVIKSPWGAALQIVHDNEVAARTSGLPVNKIRTAALVYAGLWSGAAGALGVRYLSLADADTFSLTESIMVLVVVLMSGRPSIWRSTMFGTLIASLSELLRFVTTGAFRQVAFGVLLVVMTFVLRNSLWRAERSEAPL